MEKFRELFGIRVAAVYLIFAVRIEELVMEMKKKYTREFDTFNVEKVV